MSQLLEQLADANALKESSTFGRVLSANPRSFVANTATDLLRNSENTGFTLCFRCYFLFGSSGGGVSPSSIFERPDQVISEAPT